MAISKRLLMPKKGCATWPGAAGSSDERHVQIGDLSFVHPSAELPALDHVSLGVPPGNHIGAFRCAAVTLELLVPQRREAQPDRIGPQDAIGAVENQ
jgi:hypothetical protein